MSNNLYRRAQSRNVNITSKKYDLCGYYSEMIKKCEQKIKTLVNDLAHIYKEYQINFTVFQHQESIIRLLIPIQFKSYIDDSIEYFLENHQDAQNLVNSVRFKSDKPNLFFHNQIKQRVNKNQVPSGIDKKELERRIEEKSKARLLASVKQNQQEGQHFNQERFEVKAEENYTGNFRQYKKKSSRKPGVRSRGLQNLLCSWIIQEYKRGYPVSRADVLDKAKEIGKQSNLKGSAGWYSNFIRRNPDLRAILTKGNYQRKRLGFRSENDNQGQDFKEFQNSMNDVGSGIYDEEEEMNSEERKSQESNSENNYESNQQQNSNEQSNQKKQKQEEQEQEQEQEADS